MIRLDGTEDYLISQHEEISEDIFSPQDFINDDKELNDLIELTETFKNKKIEQKQNSFQPKLTKFFIKNDNIDKMDLD